MPRNNFLIVSVVFGMVFLNCTKKIGDRAITNQTLRFQPIEVVTIHTSSGSRAPCEPTIAINPNNQNQICAGSVLDNFYISEDGGKKWQLQKLKSSFGVYGDPVIRVTKDGSIIYAHLSNPVGKAYQSKEFLDRIVIQKSKDGGQTWSDGSYPEVDHMKDHDKHWLSFASNGDVLMAWTEFDKYGSKDQKDKSRILFSTSKDEGDTWSKSVQVSQVQGDCIDDDFTTEGAVVAESADGTYFLVWAFDQKIYLNKSKDRGLTWLAKDLIIADQPGGWAYDIPGINRCNGMPFIKCDRSNGPHNGNLYVSWTDQRNGNEDTDVWVISSSDNGKNWSRPLRVNNDKPGKHQFFSNMDVDPITGYIYIVFYDRRDHDDLKTEVYLAYSVDGGRHFENIKLSKSPFTPIPTLFFGDYNDISAYNNIIRPIWTRQDVDALSIQTAIINVIK